MPEQTGDKTIEPEEMEDDHPDDGGADQCQGKGEVVGRIRLGNPEREREPNGEGQENEIVCDQNGALEDSRTPDEPSSQCDDL
jgi:hypothetical protein